MEFTTKNKKVGNVTFSIPGESYIFIDLNGKPGTLGEQICRNGELTGSTLRYSGNDYDKFKKICQNWLRSYVKKYGDIA